VSDVRDLQESYRPLAFAKPPPLQSDGRSTDMRFNDFVVVPPPPGMTEAEWEDSVEAQGKAVNAELNKGMAKSASGQPTVPLNKKDATTYTVYDATPPSSGLKPGRNSNQYASDLIQCSGGAIPAEYDPPGFNPGLRTGFDAKRKPSVLERPIP